MPVGGNLLDLALTLSHAVQVACAQSVVEWLGSIDGALTRYSQHLSARFGGTRALLEHYVRPSVEHASKLTWDTSLFCSDIAVAKLGHRRLLEKYFDRLTASTLAPAPLTCVVSGVPKQQQVTRELVHIITCGTEWRQEMRILERSALKNGYLFHAIGLGKEWGGFGTKLIEYHSALERMVGDGEIKGNDLVLLTDAWDTVILGPSTELLDKLLHINLKPEEILCGAETVCGPDFFLTLQLEALYPDGETLWRYPNSGGIVGKAMPIVKLLRGLVKNVTPDGADLDASANDQVRLHEYLLACRSAGSRAPVRLDTTCAIFQCMYMEEPHWSFEKGTPPRILNMMTGQRPVVAHGNGSTGRRFLAALYCELSLLEHLCLTAVDLSGVPWDGPTEPAAVLRGDEPSCESGRDYKPWWHSEGIHRDEKSGFEVFRMMRMLQLDGSFNRDMLQAEPHGRPRFAWRMWTARALSKRSTTCVAE
mmetsp:Transcript_9202/g.24142  ORF Transcript_9202/g.24142 Transcript_9202/m.24142 type:complete len:478 (-) Transcript_9202:146-1579(-)